MLLVDEDVGHGALAGDLLQSVLNGAAVACPTKKKTLASINKSLSEEEGHVLSLSSSTVVNFASNEFSRSLLALQ